MTSSKIAGGVGLLTVVLIGGWLAGGRGIAAGLVGFVVGGFVTAYQMKGN